MAVLGALSAGAFIHLECIRWVSKAESVTLQTRAQIVTVSCPSPGKTLDSW